MRSSQGVTDKFVFVDSCRPQWRVHILNEVIYVQNFYCLSSEYSFLTILDYNSKQTDACNTCLKSKIWSTAVNLSHIPCWVLDREAISASFQVFGLTRGALRIMPLVTYMKGLELEKNLSKPLKWNKHISLRRKYNNIILISSTKMTHNEF